MIYQFTRRFRQPVTNGGCGSYREALPGPFEATTDAEVEFAEAAVEAGIATRDEQPDD